MEKKQVTDSTGRVYAKGDYVFCATLASSYSKKVKTYIGKVVSVGETAITVVKYERTYRGMKFTKSVLQKPERDLIIPEEIAFIKSPELKDYMVEDPVWEQFDATGERYKIGDYVFCATSCGASATQTYFGRVVKINEFSIVVRRKYCDWREDKFVNSVLMVPDRHLIVPPEMALMSEPELLTATEGLV